MRKYIVLSKKKFCIFVKKIYFLKNVFRFLTDLVVVVDPSSFGCSTMGYRWCLAWFVGSLDSQLGPG